MSTINDIFDYVIVLRGQISQLNKTVEECKQAIQTQKREIETLNKGKIKKD